MGIRFYCPNGHKLNVKAELAGKMGICPKCGVHMLIPLTSTRMSGEKKGHKTANDSQKSFADSPTPVEEKQDENINVPFSTDIDNRNNINKEHNDVPVLQTEITPTKVMDNIDITGNVNIMDNAEITDNIEVMDNPGLEDSSSIPIDSHLTSYGTGSEEPVLQESTKYPPNVPEPAVSETSQSVSNSLLSDPNVVWYLRSGDQTYGPATSQVIQSWIREKRIGPTMLVWRAGWSTWIEAQNAFPELESIFIPSAPKGPAPPTVPSVQESTPIVQTNEPSETLLEQKKIEKKKKAGRDLAVVIVLVILIIILATTLCVILFGQKKEEPKNTEANLLFQNTCPMVITDSRNDSFT